LRSVFLIGVFRARGIDTGVPGPEEAEDDDEQTGNNEGVDNGGVNGVFLDL
jgi:hypothetical protein